GQQWTTLAALQAGNFHNVFKEYEPHLTCIGTEPSFAIGQRALLVQTDQGNVLWDCISYLDDDTLTAIQQRGGLKAIAISHPHFYTRAFVPVMRRSPRMRIMVHSRHVP